MNLMPLQIKQIQRNLVCFICSSVNAHTTTKKFLDFQYFFVMINYILDRLLIFGIDTCKTKIFEGLGSEQ